MPADAHPLPIPDTAPPTDRSPLDALLKRAAERTTDPDVRKWLLALLDSSERAESSPADTEREWAGNAC